MTRHTKRLTALAFVLASAGNSYAQERFWQQNKPETFAHNQTQHLINIFPRVEAQTCMNEVLATGPNAVFSRRKFKETFIKSTSAVSLAHNSLTEKLMEEYNSLSKLPPKKRNKALPHYFSWLSNLGNAFFNMRNYEGIVPVNAAPAWHIGYIPKSLRNLKDGEPEHSYRAGELGPMEPTLIRLLSEFTRPTQVQKLHEKHIEKESPFLPSFPSLSKAVENLTSQDFDGPGIEMNRGALASMVCHSLDYGNLKKYAEKFHFETPDWLHRIHEIVPEAGEVPVKVSSSEDEADPAEGDLQDL